MHRSQDKLKSELFRPVCRKTPAHPSKTRGIACAFHRLARGPMGAMGSAMSNLSSDRFQTETGLVLFSGGQDSATCLAWALQRFARVEMLGFDYGQRHLIELQCRTNLLDGIKTLRLDWAAKLGDSHTLEIPTLAEISDTALTRDVAIAMGEGGLPNTFVPGRNLVFLTFAAALAYRRGISHIVGGMCETDYSGYPDCRDETIKALQTALNLGMSKAFELHTPLMWLDKASTWKLADQLGGAALVDLICEHSHTCYLGERGARHAWGYGCGECPACALRAKGWTQYAERRG
jgi:7-cyano-7-deazaguanine synthase